MFCNNHPKRGEEEMMKRKSWIRTILLLACLSLMVPASAWAALERLDQTDFPCETIPPKCPASVGFLLQLKNLFGGEVISIDINEQIDIDPGIWCDELYVNAGGTLTVPIAGLNAELFYIRDPGDEWYEHLATGFQVTNVHLGGGAILSGRDCIGFIDFDIPIGAQIGIGSLSAVSRTAVWLDTATDEVVLTDEFADVAIGNLQFDFGLGEMIHGLIFPYLYSVIADTVESQITGDGIVLDLVGTIMDELYHVQPCGCTMLPSHRGQPPVSHILVNMAPYLLPLGMVVFLRRRKRK